MTTNVVYFILRTGLGTICLWAGIEKVRQLNQFTIGMKDYRLLPKQLVPIAARLLVIAEIVLGAILISGLTPQQSPIDT